MKTKVNGIEYECRYLTSWNYNAALIFEELEKIVLNNNGSIVSSYVKDPKPYAIINRSISGAIHEEQERIERWEKANNLVPNEARTKAIAACREKIAELERIPNAPRISYYAQYRYIQFTLNGIYYYYSVDDNPFFDFHYIKTPIKNGKYSQDAACEEDKKEWLYDCFLSWNCPHADIKEAANLIFNMLMNAKNSIVIRDSKRTRVPNIYNSGYHYETIYSPERWKSFVVLAGNETTVDK